MGDINLRLRDIFYATCVVLGTLLLAYVLYELADLIVVIFVRSSLRPPCVRFCAA
ncbi:MAG: hypothetical protein R2851_17455 [Caldilineaceae bacterium]